MQRVRCIVGIICIVFGLNIRASSLEELDYYKLGYYKYICSRLICSHKRSTCTMWSSVVISPEYPDGSQEMMHVYVGPVCRASHISSGCFVLDGDRSTLPRGEDAEDILIVHPMSEYSYDTVGSGSLNDWYYKGDFSEYDAQAKTVSHDQEGITTALQYAMKNGFWGVFFVEHGADARRQVERVVSVTEMLYEGKKASFLKRRRVGD